MKSILAYVVIGALLLNGILAAGYFSWMSMGKKDTTVVAVMPPLPETAQPGKEHIDKDALVPEDSKPKGTYERRMEVEERFSSNGPAKPPDTTINGGDRDADRDIVREKPKVPACRKKTAVKRPPPKPRQQICRINCNGSTTRRGSGYQQSHQTDLF